MQPPILLIQAIAVAKYQRKENFMCLVHYQITFKSTSLKERLRVIKEIDDMSAIGFEMLPNQQSSDFFFYSEDDLNFINIPDGCIVKKIP